MDSNADSLANSPDAGPSRTLVCECGRRFTRIENLRRHQRNHEESKLSCPTCGRTFRRPDVLKRHMRTHRGGSESSHLSRSRSRGASAGPSSRSPPCPGPPQLSLLMGSQPNDVALPPVGGPLSAPPTVPPNFGVLQPGVALEAVMHASAHERGRPWPSTLPYIPYRPLLEPTSPLDLWLPEFRSLAEDEDEDESEEEDAEDEGSEMGVWDGAVARASIQGYAYPPLAPRLAGDAVQTEGEWHITSDGAAWLTEEVYLRTKAWCVSERTIRWPDLSTANYLINTHFERVEPQLPIIHLPTFEASHAPPALITALLASGAHATPHIRARTFSCQVAETLRVLEPSDLDSLHVLLLAYLAASSCGNPRAHLILASLGSHVRTLRLLGPRQTESDFATWVRHERATRLGLAVLLFDTTLGLSDVASAPIPDQERWLLTSDAWVAREQTSVGAALATLPRYPATVGEFGASVLYTTIHYGIRAYRAEERVFGHTQEVLGLALPARVHALETLLEAAGHAYGQSVGYHLGYVLLRAPRVEDLESKSTTDPLPIVHAAHLLISAGWPLPKDNIVFSGAGYHALLILRAWASQPGPRDEDALVAELMAPRATAAPHVGPHGILPVEQAVTPAHVLKLGLQWMVNSGASGYANRLARLLDREEG